MVVPMVALLSTNRAIKIGEPTDESLSWAFILVLFVLVTKSLHPSSLLTVQFP
jgi:hypothetical protein